MNIAIFLILAAAFVPTVFLASRHAGAHMKNPKHRPTLYFFSGILFLLAGLVFGYFVFSAALSGTTPCALKGCDTNYELARQPIAYWVSVASLYCYAAASLGLGIAALQKKMHRP